jgi:hypothetical protein
MPGLDLTQLLALFAARCRKGASRLKPATLRPRARRRWHARDTAAHLADVVEVGSTA